MHDLRPHRRLALAVLACASVAGCSMFRHDARPAAPAAPAVAASAPRASVALPMPASLAPPPAAASAANWEPAVLHLDPELVVGHTWVFPSASPTLYGDIRFVFKRDRVEAGNAREHALGTWSIERDKLCVTLNTSSSGTACYYVTGTPPGELQIRALPDGDRVPLKIQ